MTIRRDHNRLSHRASSAGEIPTRLINRKDSDTPAAEPPGSASRKPEAPLPNEQTRLYRAAPPPATEHDAMQDPVVGWLVIIGGPGQGQALPLGYGRNSIARGAKARISLDFGDLEISRDEHAVITYDPKGRRFYLQHGGGTNLTYLNEQPVLVPTELQGKEIIWLGQTQLRFVPFCGEDFDWQSLASG
jgi:hypothetical protein